MKSRTYIDGNAKALKLLWFSKTFRIFFNSGEYGYERQTEIEK